MKSPEVRNWVGGTFVAAARPLLDVYDPSSGTVISRVPLSAADEVDAAVRCAKAAFPAWAATPIKERVQVFYRYKALLERDIDALAALVTEENGKIASEARAEVLKSAELTEFACSLPQIAPGEVLEVSKGVECRIERFPLGVVAAITPFNFPNMVPNWSIPNAIALGNCLVLKPSELVPLSAGRIAELLREAGLPEGGFQVVHGGREAVGAICDHPGIEAISFVGSTKVAKIVYRRGTATLKRVLALGGAKNHLIVMPDADLDMTASNVVASMAGGAEVLVDGRNPKVPGREAGYYLGPTIIDRVRPDMRIAQEEVFGPVLVIIRSRDVDEALAVENASRYGNAASVFTESGGVARCVMEGGSAGMVGGNVGVPVPREPFSFGGWNESEV